MTPEPDRNIAVGEKVFIRLEAKAAAEGVSIGEFLRIVAESDRGKHKSKGHGVAQPQATPDSPTYGGKPSVQDAVDYERFNSDTLNTSESDRGCVLVAAGYIDVALEQTIKLALSRSKASPDDIEALLSGKFAPIGDLWSRTLLALALGLISPEHKVAIDEIRSLRNFFAHHPGPVDLTDARVQRIINTLDEIGRDFASGEFAPGLLAVYSESRLRFCFAVTGIYAHLNSTHYQLTRGANPTAQTLPESKPE